MSAASGPVARWPRSGFLGQLPREEQQIALRLGTARRVGPGEVILFEGGLSDCVYLLVSGLFKVTGSLGSGREALLAVRIGGDLVGELGVTDHKPRSATVRAAGEGRVCRISDRDYHRFLSAYPKAQGAANRAMVAKLRSATRRRVEFANFTATARIARILLELLAMHGVPTSDGYVVDIDLTQEELAALIGVGAATVHRILAELRHDGVVDTGYRRVQIFDVERLRDLARR